MTIIVAEKVLDSVRLDDDNLVASAHGYDLVAATNAQTERITGEVTPGGSGSPTYQGHVHDHNGLGIGILRSVNGGFQISGPPVTQTAGTTAGTINGNYTISYPYDAPTLSYDMGVAHLSPGLDTFSVALSVKASDLTDTPQVMVYSRTLGANTGWTTILTTAAPKWYTLTFTGIVHPGGGTYRIMMDVWVKKAVDTVATTVSLYGAVPFEHANGPV